MQIGRSSPLLLIGASLVGWITLRSGYLAWLSAGVMASPPPGVMPPPFDLWQPPASFAPSPLDNGAELTDADEVFMPQATAASMNEPHRPLLASFGQLSPTHGPSVSAAVPIVPPAQNTVLVGNRLLLQRMLAFRPATHDRAGLMSAIVRPDGGMEAFPQARATPAQRWSLSAWVMARPGGGEDTLGRMGLSGSQMGVRLAWRPNSAPITAFARLNSAGRLLEGGEVAVGASLRPLRNVPVDVVVERRVNLTGPGRDAFAAYAAGGGTVMLSTDSWRLDGYGAGGVVGARRRDLFAEGAVRLDRPVGRVGPLTVRAGGAIWAATQPGVSRVDAGPSIIALPTREGGASISVDWRQRVSGNAVPTSGPAVTVAMNF